MSALIFLCDKVLGQPMPWLAEIGRPVPVRRLPVVLSRDEVAAVLGHLTGVHRLLARLRCGTATRISPGRQLRRTDAGFAPAPDPSTGLRAAPVWSDGEMQWRT